MEMDLANGKYKHSACLSVIQKSESNTTAGKLWNIRCFSECSAMLSNNFQLQEAKSFLKKPPGPQQVKKFPAFYGTIRFITALTTALHPFNICGSEHHAL